MSEIKGHNYPQAAQGSFENQTQRIQQSLNALAEQKSEAKYQKELSQFKGKYEQGERQKNNLRREVQILKKNSQLITIIRQRQKELEQRQRQTKNREDQFNDRLNRWSKEEQMLKQQQKLRQDFHNQDLQNKYKLELNKLESGLRNATVQLVVKAKQLQETNAKKINLQERLKSLNEKMGDTSARLQNLQKNHQDQAKIQQEIKNIKQQYKLRAKQLEQTLQKTLLVQVNQRQWKIKDLQAALQSQKQSFDKSLQQLHKKVQQIDVTNILLTNQLTFTRQKENSAQQKCQRLLKLVQQSERKLSKDLQNKKNQLQSHFQTEISRYYDTTTQQLNSQVEAIKEQHGKLIAQKQQLHAVEIQKLKEKLQQQRQQSSKNLSNCKIQIDGIRREQRNLRQQEQRASNQKIHQLQALIANLSNIVLDRPYKAVDLITILQAVKEKISLFKNQILDLKSENSNILGINHTLELHSKQIRQWFRNISALLNSSEAAAVLEKGQKYDIGDGDVLQSIYSFTKKLQSRLIKHKTQQETQEQQIAILSEQIRKLKMAKDGVDRDVMKLSDRVQFLDGQLRKALSQKQSAQKSIKQYALSINLLEEKIKELQSLVALKQADVISLQEEMSVIQNVKIVGYANRINQQVAKNDELTGGIIKVQRIIAGLQEQRRALSQNLADRKTQNEERLRKLQEMKLQMIERQRQWSLQRQSELTRFRGVINQLFDSAEVDNTFDGMLNYIKNHKSGSEAGPFVVSTIFETAPKGRGLLESIVCKFMQCKSIKTTFLYKYDEFNKNLANYLPIKSSYDFVLLAKTKKAQIFGVISIGLGQKSRAIAFNLNSAKTFPGEPSMSSTAYDGSYLLFGQSEIRIKNNSILELVVTTRIFNTRYFSFMKEELVGTENGESVLLDALEIHRIDY